MQELIAGVRSLREALRQNLVRERAAQQSIESAIDRSHTALAEDLVQLVALAVEVLGFGGSTIHQGDTERALAFFLLFDFFEQPRVASIDVVEVVRHPHDLAQELLGTRQLADLFQRFGQKSVELEILARDDLT